MLAVGRYVHTRYVATSFTWFSCVKSFLRAALSLPKGFFSFPSPLCCFSSKIFSATGAWFCFLSFGGSWVGCAVVPSTGTLFNLGAGCWSGNPWVLQAPNRYVEIPLLISPIPFLQISFRCFSFPIFPFIPDSPFLHLPLSVPLIFPSFFSVFSFPLPVLHSLNDNLALELNVGNIFFMPWRRITAASLKHCRVPWLLN